MLVPMENQSTCLPVNKIQTKTEFERIDSTQSIKVGKITAFSMSGVKLDMHTTRRVHK